MSLFNLGVNFCSNRTIDDQSTDLSQLQKEHPKTPLRYKNLLQMPGIAEAAGCSGLKDKFSCFENLRTGKEVVNSKINIHFINRTTPASKAAEKTLGNSSSTERGQK